MSGSTIGGIVGGAIGFMVGGPIGAQVGFAIGSAVGAYVDPVQVRGPRLSDSMAQTSTVGGMIPFGYGRYLTGGNIIWCDELKEHIKRQRQGKGGGAKTTTYTYTRSYAVGVCQGEIYGFHWIKRNGKKVYTSDPAATEEEKAYSAKWLQKVSLYLGGESQMPDSTIAAVEGAGNVSPFRGLAYIVVENDDLTDLSGAIPQYEFVVIANSVAYATTPPYAVEDIVELATSRGLFSVSNRESPSSAEGVSAFASVIEIENISMQETFTAEPECLGVFARAVEIELEKMQTTFAASPEIFAVVASAVGVENVQTRVVLDNSQSSNIETIVKPISVEVVAP